MFWSGNYMVVRELNVLLKEENVTLTQVLEADDILQECQADNKALMQFLTKPKILAELITLITEEPPKNVELASQYRHASIACEVLTSHLSTLSDRLSMDVVQMNRLCDFINRDPPLNPLLASYFSKTVEMLLERSPKQDWYLYHVVCLRVLDFFKSRRDFLPNLLRHISTSAIADTFKYFIRLDDLFNKIIMEWFEEHQFLECLIQIICGTYVPEPLAKGGAAAGAGEGAGAGAGPSPDLPEKFQLEPSEKAHANHTPHDDADKDGVQNNVEETNEVHEVVKVKAESGSGAGAGAGALAGALAGAGAEAEMRAARIAAVASANAAALLCDLILGGCAGDGYNTRARTSWALVSRLAGAGAAWLLAGMFTAPARARPHALVHGAHVLLALLDHDPATSGECDADRRSVEMAIAPHLPLLHQALLEEPARAAAGVGLARVQVAALLAHLALSDVQDVCSTMITLRTPGVVLDLMFKYEHNNFMHAQAHALVRHALNNRNPLHRTQYATHLLVECDLLTRLMDAFEENENKMAGTPRSGYMGHVVEMLRCVGKALHSDCSLQELLPAAALQRYSALHARRLHATLQRHDTPLGGYYPSENTYEFNEAESGAGADEGAGLAPDHAHEIIGGPSDHPDFLADELDMDDNEKMENRGNFLELASQRFSDDNMWEDSPAADAEAEAEAEADARECPMDQVLEVLAVPSPWESATSGAGSGSSGAGAPGAGAGAGAGAPGGGGEGWAQFDAPSDNTCFWGYPNENNTEENLSSGMVNLCRLDDSVQLATKLLSAMADMPPHLVATIVASTDDKRDPFEDYTDEQKQNADLPQLSTTPSIDTDPAPSDSPVRQDSPSEKLHPVQETSVSKDLPVQEDICVLKESVRENHSDLVLPNSAVQSESPVRENTSVEESTPDSTAEPSDGQR